MRTSGPWTTRAETHTDIPAIHGVHRAAFETPAEAELVDALRVSPAWVKELSIVSTTDNGTVVGHALLTRCYIDDIPALALAPCAVLPKYQRMGFGSAAIRAVLDSAHELRETFVVVLGHPEYYPRFGFEPAATYGIRLSIEVPDDALMVLVLGAHQTPPAGMVRYAEPFGI